MDTINDGALKETSRGASKKRNSVYVQKSYDVEMYNMRMSKHIQF